MIEPIRTRYGGKFFRSRTEARWSVLFDAIGLAHDYEAEGFVIRSGAYLPDFWLRDVRMFLEVKGAEPTGAERAKCAELCMAAECDVLLAIGNPEERFQILWFDRDGEREQRYALAQDRRADCGFWLVSEDHANWIGSPKTGDLPRGPMFSGVLERAYDLAAGMDFKGDGRRVQPLEHGPDRRAA